MRAPSCSQRAPLRLRLRLLLLLLLAAAAAPRCGAHSQMTQPQSTSPRVCRVGGQPQFGERNCRGPCDLVPVRARPRWANFWSPRHPAATYRRGQRAVIKYARNNHGPGGFVRLTLVPTDRVMSAAAHAANAFHYSCWGAHAVIARGNELRRARFGFSMVGSDGGFHHFPKGYYQVTVTIPTVVPDGDYVLGWAWYGGTGGQLRSATRQQYPKSTGYFGDYYSCAFVRIKGGRSTRTYRPRFVNNMRRFSSVGCMASADRPGVCASEPCIKKAWFRPPRPFAAGRRPAPLTRAHFEQGTGSSTATATRQPPYWRRVLAACHCVRSGAKCARALVRRSNWRCRARTHPAQQPPECRRLCCQMCRVHRHVRDVCWARNVRATCGF